MSDLNLDLVLDGLAQAIIACVPRTLPAFRFRHHNGAVPLEECEDPFRTFELRDGDLTCADVDTPNANEATVWYKLDVEIAIVYPKTFLVPGDTANRGLAGLRLEDTVDLNRALMFSDPLAAVLPADVGYKLPQLVRSSRAGRVRSLVYRLYFEEAL